WVYPKLHFYLQSQPGQNVQKQDLMLKKCGFHDPQSAQIRIPAFRGIEKGLQKWAKHEFPREDFQQPISIYYWKTQIYRHPFRGFHQSLLNPHLLWERNIQHWQFFLFACISSILPWQMEN